GDVPAHQSRGEYPANSAESRGKLAGPERPPSDWERGRLKNHDIERLAPSCQLDAASLDAVGGPSRSRPHVPRRQDLAGPGDGAEPRGDVDGVAERGEVELVAGPEHAHERGAVMDAGSDPHTRTGQRRALDGLDELQPGSQRSP